MGHWPINRRCANQLCAYGILPILVVNVHYDQANPMIFSSRKHSSPKTSYSPENELQVPFTRVRRPGTRKGCHYISFCPTHQMIMDGPLQSGNLFLTYNYLIDAMGYGAKMPAQWCKGP